MGKEIKFTVTLMEDAKLATFDSSSYNIEKYIEKIITSAIDGARICGVKDNQVIFAVETTAPAEIVERLRAEFDKACGEDSSKIISIISLINLSNEEEPQKNKKSKIDALFDSDDEEEAEEEDEIYDIDAVNQILDKIDKLVGMNEFKEYAHEIVKVAPLIHEHQSFSLFRNQSLLVSINDGDGLEKALLLLNQLMNTLGLYNGNGKLYNLKLSIPTKDIPKPLDFNDDVFSGKGSLTCFDISDWMTKIRSYDFRDFLMRIKDNLNNKLFIFRVPYVDKDVLQMVKDDLNDILFVRTICFIPYSSEELFTIAKEHIASIGYFLKDDCYELFLKKIAEEKNDSRFYGEDTIVKICSELVYSKMLNSIGMDNSNEITKDDFEKIIKNLSVSNMNGYDELNSLVGMEEVKSKIKEIVTQIKTSLKYSSTEKPCIHMRFVGAPGTGKTTTARILGKILKEEGILSIGNFYEVKGRDFVGKYIGHTAPRTMEICRDAYGSILFVDEAYSLYHSGGDSKDFGVEALDTLVAELENHRSDMVVIFAGYTAEMNAMLQGNVGLASRVPYEISFNNYSRDDLLNIFMSMVKKNKIDYSADFENEAKDYFMNIADDVLQTESFGNARFVRNLYERTFAKASIRIEFTKANLSLEKEDFVNAKSEKEFALLNKKKISRIGF